MKTAIRGKRHISLSGNSDYSILLRATHQSFLANPVHLIYYTPSIILANPVRLIRYVLRLSHFSEPGSPMFRPSVIFGEIGPSDLPRFAHRSFFKNRFARFTTSYAQSGRWAKLGGARGTGELSGLLKNGDRLQPPPPASFIDKSRKRPSAGKDLSFSEESRSFDFTKFRPSVIFSGIGASELLTSPHQSF